MYGKHFASMYTGSMVGMGPVAFSVWGYVIAHMVPDKEVGAQVELNPDFLSRIIGDTTPEQIEEAIIKFCAPDKKSRTPDHEGRKLIRLGQFDYQVVNGAKYRDIKKQENRRKQNREAQKRWRDKQKEGKMPKKGTPLPGENNYVNSELRKAREEEGQ